MNRWTTTAAAAAETNIHSQNFWGNLPPANQVFIHLFIYCLVMVKSMGDSRFYEVSRK